MPSRLVSEDQLLDRLTDVFRSAGFDGASLTDLAAASGLQRSSLYHRFPGGKEQMATEVIEHLGTKDASSTPASSDTDLPVRARIEQVGRALTAFYDAGAKSCLLDTMSLGDRGEGTSAALAAAANGWITELEGFAATTGVKPA
ncbi:MAG TPA: TetR/AcrR family transcriptional regulator, partial [Ilumatobacteraceae bacterium]|nr:TetR/AcrR family transcriptional regulator [Ilumatobacteraceae bacterium]